MLKKNELKFINPQKFKKLKHNIKRKIIKTIQRFSKDEKET